MNDDSIDIVNRIIHNIKSCIVELPLKERNIVIAYSGGKDSTLLLHAVVEALQSKAIQVDKVYILYNDTLGEIPSIHRWAMATAKAVEAKLKSLGIEADSIVTKPNITDTYYWRTIFRGYPAPNFKFRWCIDLLKIFPTKRELQRLSEKHRTIILLTGLRNDESPARARSLRSRRYMCMSSLENSSCHDNYVSRYVLRTDFVNTIKLAPMVDIKEVEIWNALKKLKPPWDGGLGYEFLLVNYLSILAHDKRVQRCRVRFGCWFCTVTFKHCGLKASIEASKLIHDLMPKYKDYVPLPEKLELLAKLREFLQVLSNSVSLREPKSEGYSKLGPLKPVARSAILQALWKVDKVTNGEILYGLSEYVHINSNECYQLRDILFYIDAHEAMRIIRYLDDNPRVRSIDLELARDSHYVFKELKRLALDNPNDLYLKKAIKMYEELIHSM